VMEGSIEAEIDSVVEHRLALHALADAGLDQEIACPLLDQAGANAALDVLAAAVLQDDRVDARTLQEMRQHQPGPARANDSNLRAHSFSLPRCLSAGCYASAALRSSIRSSASSIPTESRTRVSLIPSVARTSAGTEPCVMSAGCSIRLSTPPRLSA